MSPLFERSNQRYFNASKKEKPSEEGLSRLCI
jgi:hypothetical protein